MILPQMPAIILAVVFATAGEALGTNLGNKNSFLIYSRTALETISIVLAFLPFKSKR